MALVHDGLSYVWYTTPWNRDGPPQSQDEHEVRMEFHTGGIAKETWNYEDEKATDVQNLDKWWRSEKISAMEG
jgi:hypothetical protein